MFEVRVYPDSPANHDDIVKKAKEVGFDQIDFSKGYSLEKRVSKREGGYPDGFKALRDGSYYVVGYEKNGELLVWLYGVRYNGEWFKTSPVVKVEKTDKGFLLETWNSVYELNDL